MVLGYRQPKQLHRFEAPRSDSPSELDEVLISDARAGLTPADMVERKLLHLLEVNRGRSLELKVEVIAIRGPEAAPSADWENDDADCRDGKDASSG
ncbi:MAG: hypothetical protein ACYC3I_23165 [Gemmataceae bacterium]